MLLNIIASAVCIHACMSVQAKPLSVTKSLVDPGVNKVPYFYHDVHE